MKKNEIGLLTAALALGFLLTLVSVSFGDTEIDLGDLNTSAPATTAASKPTPAPTPKAAPTTAATKPTPAATPKTASQDIQLEDNSQPETQTAAEPTPTAVVIHGVLKMKDVYEAGVNSYKDRDYGQAIRYWTKAVRMSDPYTPKLYYAEAYAMMGIIYQYHLIHYGRAYRCYAEALKYEKHNQTARRHIHQVYKYRHRKD